MIYTNDVIKDKLEKRKQISNRIRMICIPLVVFLIISSISIIYQKIVENENFVDILGFKSFVVLTGSMEPEIDAGDVVIIKQVPIDSINTGDIITYLAQNTNQTVTHRVIEKIEKNGVIYYRTKGDNNNSADTELITYDNILGTVSFKLNKFGVIIKKLQTTSGIILIMFVLIIDWVHMSRKNSRILAREEIRRKYNSFKYVGGTL